MAKKPAPAKKTAKSKKPARPAAPKPAKPPGILARVTSMQDYIRTGRIIEAMTEFYAPDSSMQENAEPPCVGLAANIEREKQFMSEVKQWIDYTAQSIAVSGDTAFVESSIDFIHVNGAKVHMEQVSVSRWKNGKITSERFYHESTPHK